MKKGHRRTNSQTIGLARPYHHDLQKTLQKQQPVFEYLPQPQKPVHHFASIQTLLEKSETNISQRILYIQNLQQPHSSQDNNDFSFGKGINYKLACFKLNMGEIPEVPKSNQSTSLQGENKLDLIDKETYFPPETSRTHLPTHCRTVNHLSKPLKFQPKHTKTTSAVGIKKIIKVQKHEKPETKLQIKSVHENRQKQNPLKRPKFEYQILKKPNLDRDFVNMNAISTRVHKEEYLQNFIASDKRKKKGGIL